MPVLYRAIVRLKPVKRSVAALVNPVDSPSLASAGVYIALNPAGCGHIPRRRLANALAGQMSWSTI
jgi:hypothetical protein